MSDENPIRHALGYLDRGWAVVPLVPRAKHPLVSWQELQGCLPKRNEVENWIRRWPAANIGIVTGAVSHLVVLDIDPQHSGNESLIELERQHGRSVGYVEVGAEVRRDVAVLVRSVRDDGHLVTIAVAEFSRSSRPATSPPPGP